MATNAPFGAYAKLSTGASGNTVLVDSTGAVLIDFDASGNVTANVIAALQAKLDAGGDANVYAAGTLSTNAELVIGSNTAFKLNKNARLKQAASTAKRMLKNENEISALITLGSAITAAVSNFTTEYIATVPVGAGHPFTAGSHMLVKGDTTGTYNGIWEVYDVTATTARFMLGLGNAVPGSSTGTITVALADANITIDGGIWDYNAQNNTAGSADYNGHFMTLNKVRNAVVENVTLMDGLNYGITLFNAHECRISNIDADTGKDGIHLFSTINCLVENVTGTYGDDVVAVSHDCPTGYTQYSLDYLSANASMLGDINNLSFRNLHPKRTAGAVVALYPGLASLGKKFDNIDIEDISCSSGAKKLLNINNNLDVGAKSVGFVRARGLSGKADDAMVLVEGSASSLLTVDKLELSELYRSRDAGASYSKGADIAFTYGIANKLVVDGFYPYTNITTAKYGIYFTNNTSYCPDITVRNFALETTGSGSSLSLLAASGAAGFKTVNIENGQLLAGSALLAGSWPSTTKFYVDNVTVDGGLCLIATAAATFDILCSDCGIVSASQNCAFNFYASSGSGTINLHVRNLKHALSDIIANLKKRMTVSGAANNGSGLIRLTVDSTAGWSTGNSAIVANVGGVAGATGTWVITVVDATHVDLQGTTFAGVYTSGGTASNAQVVNVFGDATAKTDLTKIGTAANQMAVHNGANTAGTIDSGALCVCDTAGVWRQLSDPTNKHYP